MSMISQLCDEYNLSVAEKAGSLNWHSRCSRLLVANTVGDGNCLAHASSLQTWGVHDRDGQIRGCIEHTMCTQSPASLEAKQRYFEVVQADRRAVGLAPLTPDECEAEWQGELQVFDPTALRMRDRYLGAIHVFILANVLRRPIILYGDEEAVTAGLAGIYLPVLWRDPQSCSKVPIMMLYQKTHFSSLAVEFGQGPVHVPLAIRSC
eukprot:CAMPEP_0114546684 /NCGR_PEP_ID=MMETSP0114-20121206/4064_1 /TAXON_ID=31324 /ORGANISM="Goniomonas sp, Strain m" /LENGTH=206 /DNA_ID=CAMNT_0001731193 /DNA_START=119 /DNA_END=736 /DNA_ORIENTATION=+